MSTWCENELVVTGTPEQVADFRAKYVEPGFSFERIVPIDANDSPGDVYRKWGTRSEVSDDFNITDESEKWIVMRFTTVLTPALGIAAAIEAMGLTVELDFIEMDGIKGGFYTTGILQDGPVARAEAVHRWGRWDTFSENEVHVIFTPAGKRGEEVMELHEPKSVNQAAEIARRAHPGATIRTVLWEGEGYMPEAAA